MKTHFVVLAVLAASSTSLVASAQQQQQPWLKDRRYGEGIGIRTGNLELHPGIAGEIGYDTNYFQRADGEDPPPVSSIRFKLTPSLSLATLGTQRRAEEGAGAPPTLNFRAGLYATYNELVATDSKYSDEFSKQRHIDAGVNFTLDVLPQRPWGADFYGDFVRTVEPSNSFLTDLAFDRDTLRLGAGINWRPGGGLFEWRIVGYELNYSFFERDTYKDFNNAQHLLKTRNRWRFLPRTAVLSDAEVGFVQYTNTKGTQNDGQFVQARVGLNGLVTNHFALLALGGWASSFYEDNGPIPARNYDGPVGQAEFKWYVLPPPNLDPTAATVGLSSIALGYTRNYQNSYLGAYYRRDRGYLDFSYFIGGQVILALNGGFARITYPTSYFTDGTVREGSFGENRLDATLFAEYRPSDTIGINTTLRYNANLDSRKVRIDPTNAAAVDDLQFKRFEAYLGLRWFM